MPKTGKGEVDREASRGAILAAAAGAVRRQPASSLTVDAVASAAGCAKGLVHYHFKTKLALFAAVAERIWQERTGNWTRALATGEPERAIADSWTLLSGESDDGTSRACASLAALGSEVTDRAVNEAVKAFAASLSDSVARMLRHVGLEPSISAMELGQLATAVVLGTGAQLDHGGAATEVEGAYVAFWAGLLSLTRPARGDA